VTDPEVIDPEPHLRFYSFRAGAPMPQPCAHYELHPAADPLCIPHREALGMGLEMLSPLDWALTRTAEGMRVGWIRPDDTIAWQAPDELGNVYHPEGPALLDGLPVDHTRARKIIVPGRGLQFANVKDSPRPGLVEIISGWLFTPATPGWGLRVGWPSGTPMPAGLADVPHGYFQPWYTAPFPTVFRIDRVGAVVRFRRGDPMAAFVPLPDTVREGSRTDGRELSGGVAEWPAELRERVAAVTDAIYRRRGGYSAVAHRTDRTGVCPVGHTPAMTTPEPEPTFTAKQLLAATLGGLDIPIMDDTDGSLLLLTGEHSSEVAALLAAAGVPAARDRWGVRLPVGSARQNGQALAVLARSDRVPRHVGPTGRLAILHRAQRSYEPDEEQTG
jgi:hypothetical protein